VLDLRRATSTYSEAVCQIAPAGDAALGNMSRSVLSCTAILVDADISLAYGRHQMSLGVGLIGTELWYQISRCVSNSQPFVSTQ
jgi:hypothetical protein